jgi:cell division protein FtsN
LTSELGMPARAARVELGSSGIWYRVVVGEFATAQEAQAMRARLQSRYGSQMSSIYWVSGS